MKEVAHTVAAAEAGRTLAALLHQHAGVSHRVAKGIVDAGLVTVDGRPARDPAARLAAGARLAARFEPGRRYAPSFHPARQTPWYRRVLDDPSFLVVDKPPGVLTVPAGAKDGRSLIEHLLEAESPTGRRRGLWVVHRIDRFVSGLVVVARTPEALASLRGQFAARTVLREYLAICEGAPPADRGELVGYLAEHPKSLKVAPTAPGEGERAVLAYRVIERLRGACLVEVRLETGRRNQIRVQFASSGCPLLGDVAYGRPSPILGRVALHAARLEFRHPVTGDAVRCAAEPPPDFEEALETIRDHGLRAGRGEHRPAVLDGDGEALPAGRPAAPSRPHRAGGPGGTPAAAEAGAEVPPRGRNSTSRPRRGSRRPRRA